MIPDEFWEADKVLRILKLKWKQIESAIGLFVPAGKSILTIEPITENVEWSVAFRGENVKVRIDVDTCK